MTYQQFLDAKAKFQASLPVPAEKLALYIHPNEWEELAKDAGIDNLIYAQVAILGEATFFAGVRFRASSEPGFKFAIAQD